MTKSKIDVIDLLAQRKQAQTNRPTPRDSLYICSQASSSYCILAESTSILKHGIATFTHDSSRWSFVGQSQDNDEIEWLFVDAVSYLIVNVYKPLPTKINNASIPIFPPPCLYAGDFSYHHSDWGYHKYNKDGESLSIWATIKNLSLLYSPKNSVSFHSGCYETETNPDLAFLTANFINSNHRRKEQEKFPRSQHQTSMITQTFYIYSTCTRQVMEIQES